MMDWQLTYPARGVYPGANLAFGGIASGYIMTAMPLVETPEIRTDDTVHARADGEAMGQDFLSGVTVPFSLTVDGESEEEGMALVAALRRAWRGDAIRKVGGAVATLTSHHGRRAFGRPRRFTPNATFSHVGRFDVTADFRAVDDLWYGPDQVQEVRIIPTAGRGLRAPLRSPLTTVATSVQRQEFTVRGDLPTWAVIEVDGPITNADVEIPGVLRQQVRGSLAYDETLVIDARSWSRSVRVNGASAPGRRLRASTPLTEALIPPGTHELVLRGTSETGTARARVRWADAFTTY